MTLTADVEALLDRIPVLQGLPRTVRELPGGLTNQNLHVTTSRGDHVVRVFRGDAALLGIDRDAEHLNSLAAAEAGVGAPVVDYRPDLGVLVIGYLEGVTLTNEDFSREGVVRRVAEGIKKLHDGPRFVGEFDMFERQRRYRRRCREQGFAVPAGYDDFGAEFQEIQRALAIRQEGTVPCNNDLLAANFVDDGTQMWLIDYEYSGNNDACFELGNTWTECKLTLDQLEELVTSYYGRPLRNKIARAHLQGVVSQYGWALWGSIQHAVSPLDFDFEGWGAERYEGAVAEMRSPGFRTLLDDVQAAN